MALAENGLKDAATWVLPEAAAKALEASKQTYQSWMNVIENALRVLVAHGVPTSDLARVITDGIGRVEYVYVREHPVYRTAIEHNLDLDAPAIRICGDWMESGLIAAGLSTLASLAAAARG